MTSPLVATPGALLAGFRFPTQKTYDNAAGVFVFGMDNANALNPLSTGSGGGYTWGTTNWTSASSVVNPNNNWQFVSLTPVILPAG